MACITPLITIGITCFNSLRTISSAINSALVQDWVNTEIIIVDDCSVDGTPDFINSNFFNCKITLLINKENKGVAFCRNQIIDHANGSYITFFDDDDISDPKELVGNIKV